MLTALLAFPGVVAAQSQPGPTAETPVDSKADASVLSEGPKGIFGRPIDDVSGGSLQIYGHLNPAVISFDDGVDRENTVVDNAHSPSRIGFLYVHPNDGREVQFRFETALGARLSSAVTQGDSGEGFSWDKTDIRFADLELTFENGSRLSFGQGSMASDGSATIDLSGTALANGVSIADVGAGYFFRAADGTLTTVKLGDAFKTFDGVRRGRIRYDSPSWGGFSIATSAGTDILNSANDVKNFDVAMRYNTETDRIRMRGALAFGYTDRSSQSDRKDFVGSLAVVDKSSGVNYAVSAGRRVGGGYYVYGKLGYSASWFAVGKTAVSIDYMRAFDTVSTGSRADGWGVAVVQSLSDLGLEVYLGYRNYALEDDSAISYRDAESLMLGTRWTF